MANGGWLDYLPYASGGFSALGNILSLIQQYQRNKQMEDLRRYYMDPSRIMQRAQQYWAYLQPSAARALSLSQANWATRAGTAQPLGLQAQLVADAYAPYQAQALQMALGLGGEVSPYTIKPAGATDPFAQFLNALQAVKALKAGGGGERQPVSPPPTTADYPLNTMYLPSGSPGGMDLMGDWPTQ